MIKAFATCAKTGLKQEPAREIRVDLILRSLFHFEDSILPIIFITETKDFLFCF